MLGVNSSDTARRDSIGGATLYASPHAVPPTQAFIQLHTLTKQCLTISVTNKCRVSHVLRLACMRVGIAQCRVFGLAVRVPSEGLGGDTPRNEYLFLEPEHLLHKYIGKQSRLPWVSSKEANVRRLLLFLRVRVYVDNLALIACPRALEHYYIQLKENVLDQWWDESVVSEERCWEMAALSFKADRGETTGPIRAEQYFPLWIIERRGVDYVVSNMAAISNDLAPMTKQEAMRMFCQEAARQPFTLNTHVYGMRRHRLDTMDNALLAISPRGIEIWTVDEEGERHPLRRLDWNRIERISFHRKALAVVGLDSHKVQLYAQNESKARSLLSLCRSVHQTVLNMTLGHFLPPIGNEYHEKNVDEVSVEGGSVSSSRAGSTPRRTPTLSHIHVPTHTPIPVPSVPAPVPAEEPRRVAPPLDKTCSVESCTQTTFPPLPLPSLLPSAQSPSPSFQPLPSSVYSSSTISSDSLVGPLVSCSVPSSSRSNSIIECTETVFPTESAPYASVSLHDLRTSSVLRAPPQYHETLLFHHPDHMPSSNSESRIDALSSLLHVPVNVNRSSVAISRVHSMPAHHLPLLEESPHPIRANPPPYSRAVELRGSHGASEVPPTQASFPMPSITSSSYEEHLRDFPMITRLMAESELLGERGEYVLEQPSGFSTVVPAFHLPPPPPYPSNRKTLVM